MGRSTRVPPMERLRMFAPNGKLIRGIHIHLMWELQELEGVEEDTNARD